MVTEEDVRRAKAITEEIHVAGQEARDSIEVAKVEATRARRKDAYWYLIMVLTSLTFAVASAVFSWANTNESERKFCAIMATSLNGAERRLAAYDANPPTTDAGMAQRGEALVSVTQLRTLKHDLDCPPD